MNILLPALYAGTAALHIFSIHAEKRRLRFASKICLMPVLLSFYIYKADAPSAAIIAALIFSWAGDVLLVRPQKYGLYAGIGSFFAAHAAYGFAFISLAPSPRGLVYVFLCALIVPPGFLFIVKPRAAAPLRVAGALYASAVCLLVVFAARVFAYYKNLPALALTG
ncbi:MAG: lysoplasmalogenase, partial [Spirochaetaceae bacterium]|nr:lysoplasmalogenase [Spirochaetaceae bacterium]